MKKYNDHHHDDYALYRSIYILLIYINTCRFKLNSQEESRINQKILGVIGIIIILLCLVEIVGAIVSGYDFTDSNELDNENSLMEEKIIDDSKHIPEFSSIAFPIAIIIGILFIYTSHKEK